MTQLTNSELMLMLGSVVFAIIFFIAVSIAILLFFKRLQRQDDATTQEDETD